MTSIEGKNPPLAAADEDASTTELTKGFKPPEEADGADLEFVDVIKGGNRVGGRRPGG